MHPTRAAAASWTVRVVWSRSAVREGAGDAVQKPIDATVSCGVAEVASNDRSVSVVMRAGIALAARDGAMAGSRGAASSTSTWRTSFQASTRTM